MARWRLRLLSSRRPFRPIVLLLGLLTAANVIVPARAAEPLAAADPATVLAATRSALAGVTLSAALPTVPGPILLARPASVASPAAPRFLFGSWIKPRGSESHAQAVAGMETKVGRRFSIDHVYHGWQNPLIGPYERGSIRRGHALLINWKAALEWSGGKSNGAGAGYVRWSDIAGGTYDRLIADRARELRGLRTRVYLNFHHEPEDDADRPWDRRAGSPAEFVAAWRHIWTVFKRHGADNVRFVFILMGWSFKTTNAANFYPGRRYVDVIGSDAYNWFGTAHPHSDHWADVKSIFGAGYRFATAERRPFWITETGVMEDPSNPGRKAEWLRSIRSQVKRWPNLQGLVYFMGGRFGWYADSSPQALAAFRALARAVSGRTAGPSGPGSPLDLDVTA